MVLKYILLWMFLALYTNQVYAFTLLNIRESRIFNFMECGAKRYMTAARENIIKRMFVGESLRKQSLENVEIEKKSFSAGLIFN